MRCEPAAEGSWITAAEVPILLFWQPLSICVLSYKPWLCAWTVRLVIPLANAEITLKTLRSKTASTAWDQLCGSDLLCLRDCHDKELHVSVVIDCIWNTNIYPLPSVLICCLQLKVEPFPRNKSSPHLAPKVSPAEKLQQCYRKWCVCVVLHWVCNKLLVSMQGKPSALPVQSRFAITLLLLSWK